MLELSGCGPLKNRVKPEINIREMNWGGKQKRESEEIQYFHPDKRG